MRQKHVIISTRNQGPFRVTVDKLELKRVSACKYHVQRVSAKHGVKGRLRFPMGTCHFQAPTQQKPLDRSF
jgi:hypothetical protein